MALDFENEIRNTLEIYSEDIAEKVKQEVKEVTSKGLKLIKSNSPVKTGSYRKGWRKKKIKSTIFGDEWVLFNKTDYRLTHLLEKGHAKKNGGMVKAYPHISKVEKEVTAELLKRVEAVIKNES